MRLEEVEQTARRRAAELPQRGLPVDVALERLRTECVAFFTKVPEPPLYRRYDDPARKVAELLLPEGAEVWAKCLALGRDETAARGANELAEAVKLHLEGLCATAAGRLEDAESAWQAALEKERRAVGARRLWSRSDENPLPVFDPRSGVSRFDPRPEAMVRVKLACPQASCHQQAEYSFSPRHSTQEFSCPSCRAPFIAFFGSARQTEVEERPKSKLYRFLVEDLSGRLSRIEFEEGSGADFTVATRDLLAFLYTRDQHLKGLLNLSSGRLLWVRSAGTCFIATAVYGEGAAELGPFRAFRDRALLRTPLGRKLVDGYYRAGPWAARKVSERPLLKAATRWVLGRVHHALVRSGYR